MQPYPILLAPYVSEAVWGGRRLAEEYGVDPGGKANCAEAWVLSAHPKGSASIRNGALTGQSLAAVAAQKPAWFGGKPLGVLVKLIDAREALSVQVHPTDGAPCLRPGEAGKTECWYILDAAPGASLTLGFREQITKATFERAIRENALSDLLRKQPVRRGDFFFIPAGTLHAIGAGVLLAEVQQSSDTTYRVFDYNRQPPRELHISQALCAAELAPYAAKEALPLRCPYFSVAEWQGARQGAPPQDAFLSLLVLDGRTQLAAAGEVLPLRKGDCVLLPAGMGGYTLESGAHILAVQG
ncbi:MAG: mannose-6-phosphate isomerase [Oscillospiraceae bacterium]|nr:mannose-6-phosphate isomerase [Oscillospiraceae bacterium]